MVTGLKLLATAGLGAAYLLVAILAAHPRVDAEYAAHFLRRTADCWLPRASRAAGGAPPASIEVGRLGYPEACRYLRLNWHVVEDWGAWAGAGHAVLHLPWRPGAAGVQLTLRGVPAPGPAVSVRSVLNGEAATTEIPPGTVRAVLVPLPADQGRHDPELRLSFSRPAAVPDLRQNRRPRIVSVGLVAITYLPDSGESGPAQPASKLP